MRVLNGFYWVKLKSSGGVVVAHIVSDKVGVDQNWYPLDAFEVLRLYRPGSVSLVEMRVQRFGGKWEKTVYEIIEGRWLEVQGTSSANAYWHHADHYKPERGDKILREKRVCVASVGQFDSREQFIGIMVHNRAELVTIVEE